MSKTTSPTHFTGESDHFYDPNFTAEISQKMRVPKRLKVDGGSDEPIVNYPHIWAPTEKLEMHVPEKIVVLGKDEHYGMRALPRELELENTVMPPDPGMVRVQTPPRVITLDKHYYPSADDYQPTSHRDQVRKVSQVFDNLDQRLDISAANVSLSDGQQTEGMSTYEEVVHLRKQLAKLNRRVMSIELENMQRQQREKILYAIGLAYLFFKALGWFSRSS